jgi:integrase
MARSTGILRVVRKSGETRWRARWTDAYGARRSAVFSTESGARLAQRQRQAEADRIRAGVAQPKSDKTIREASAEWLKTRPPKRKVDDESHLRVHILPLLGELRLAEINATVLEGFKRDMEAKSAARVGQRSVKPLSPQTIKNVLVCLAKMLGDLGFDHRIRYKVPTSGYRWIERAEDVGRFLDACEPPWFKVAAAISVYAGLRQGEVAGLRRDALDFDRGLIRVDRSYDGPTKSTHVRWAPMPPELAAVLRPWLLRHPGPLVVTKEGEPLTEDAALYGYAKRACKRAGLDRVTFHQLRHTAASHLALRVPLPMVGAVLGHADPKTTARYAHLDSESVARDPRLHLTFEAPAGTVVPLGRSGPPVDRGAEGSPPELKTATIAARSRSSAG